MTWSLIWVWLWDNQVCLFKCWLEAFFFLFTDYPVERSRSSGWLLQSLCQRRWVERSCSRGTLYAKLALDMTLDASQEHLRSVMFIVRTSMFIRLSQISDATLVKLVRWPSILKQKAGDSDCWPALVWECLAQSYCFRATPLCFVLFYWPWYRNFPGAVLFTLHSSSSTYSCYLGIQDHTPLLVWS